MSGYENYSDILGNDGSQETGGGLRKMLEDALALNRELVDRLNRTERDKTVAVLFKEKGLDPKVAELMGDADPAEWLSKYGELFKGDGSKLDAPAPDLGTDAGSAPSPEALQREADLQAEREAYESISGLGSGAGLPSKANLDAVDKIKSFDNEADLMKYINSGGREG